MTVPNLHEILSQFAATREMNIFTALPAKVEAYDPATGLADLAPVVGGLWIDRDSGERTQVPLGKVPAVPVMQPRGGGMMVSVPLQPGEYVLMVCTTYSFSKWYNDGKDFKPQVDNRRHALDQCFCIPGVFNSKTVYPDVHPENLVMGESEGTQIWIQPDNGQILLGGDGAANFVAMANLTQSELTAITAAIAEFIPVAITAAAIVPGSLPVTSDQFLAFTTSLVNQLGARVAGSVSATKVKAL